MTVIQTPMVDERWFCSTVQESASLDPLTVGSLVDWCSRKAAASGSPFDRIYERRYNDQGEGIGPRMEISMEASDIVLEVALAMSQARDAAFEAACPSPRPSPTHPSGSDECPEWCTAHNGFDDGSSDWHQSADYVAGGQTFYISAGTHTGQPEVFTTNALPESMTLDETEAFAQALLVAVAAARGEAGE